MKVKSSRLKMSYEAYAAHLPVGKLDLVLDEEHGGVDIHLAEIADALVDYETKLIQHLNITSVEMKDIKTLYSADPALER